MSILEAVKGPNVGNIEIKGKEFSIVRTYHVMQTRNSGKIPRDSFLSKQKYINLFKSIDINFIDNKQAIVFKTKDYYSYIIFTIKDYKIYIITAIIQKANKSEQKIINKSNRDKDIETVYKGSIEMKPLQELNEGNFGDIILSYRILKDLGTPWIKTNAYKLGIIDKDGKKLKSPESDEEKDAYNSYYKIIFNLKRILQRVVGKSSVTQKIATVFLLKEGHTQRGVDLICEKLSLVDFKEVNEADLDYINALIESYKVLE